MYPTSRELRRDLLPDAPLMQQVHRRFVGLENRTVHLSAASPRADSRRKITKKNVIYNRYRIVSTGTVTGRVADLQSVGCPPAPCSSPLALPSHSQAQAAYILRYEG